jgi:outer membrane biosynthesis protein TonB
MIGADLENLDIDFSLAPEAKAEAPAAKAPAAPAKKPEPKKPAPKPEAKAPQPKPEPPKPAPVEPEKVEKPEAPKPAAPQAAPSSAGAQEYVEVDLTDEELAALRELIEVFKNFKGLINGLAEFGKKAMK